MADQQRPPCPDTTGLIPERPTGMEGRVAQFIRTAGAAPIILVCVVTRAKSHSSVLTHIGPQAGSRRRRCWCVT
jgi:hypothetical protein